jgi:hypothetical protein
MKKRNWLSKKTAGIIVAYAVILLVFGLPFEDKDLTGELSRKVAYQDTSFSQFVDTSEGIIFWVLVGAFICDFFCLARYIGYLLRRANTIERARRVILLGWIHGLSVPTACIFYACVVTSNFYLAHFSQDVALREFARNTFVLCSAAFLMTVWCSLGVLEHHRSCQKQWPARRIVANYYWRECQKLRKEEQHEAAEQMLAKACEHYPGNISVWALRAYVAEAELDRPQEAAVYLANAARNLSETSDTNDGEKAQYEYFLGYLKLYRRQIEEGIRHIERSLELHHDKSLVELLKKLREYRDSQDKDGFTYREPPQDIPGPSGLF